MYSRQEAARLKQEFWTVFGRYMAPVLSAEGEKISWVNYKTGVKFIAVKLSATNNEAAIALTFTHPDPTLQKLQFSKAGQLEKLLSQPSSALWIWSAAQTDEHGRTVSLIHCSLCNLSVYQKEAWPQLISFFKEGMILLDAFWSQARFHVEDLF